MSKLLLSLCTVAVLWTSTQAHAALGTSSRPAAIEARDHIERLDVAPAGESARRLPGPGWFLGVGCVSLFALQRLRRMGLERLRREERFMQAQRGAATP